MYSRNLSFSVLRQCSHSKSPFRRMMRFVVLHSSSPFVVVASSMPHSTQRSRKRVFSLSVSYDGGWILTFAADATPRLNDGVCTLADEGIDDCMTHLEMLMKGVVMVVRQACRTMREPHRLHLYGIRPCS